MRQRLPHLRAARRKPRSASSPPWARSTQGHLSLVARRACTSATTVAASIFVNPTQFAPGEDFARYPRTFDDDCALLEREGVDLLFAPSADEMYPAGNTGTFVEVPGIGDRLDGASRPGHFRGVATVVAKLFHIVQPDRAFFGQKDAAQVAVLRAMVRDLDLPVDLRVCPTVRDADGLALSSRNRYLSPDERHAALAIPAALQRAQTLLAVRHLRPRPHSAPRCIDELRALSDSTTWKSSTPHTLEPAPNACGGALLAVAAWVGSTRLIDNILIESPR